MLKKLVEVTIKRKTKKSQNIADEQSMGCFYFCSINSKKISSSIKFLEQKLLSVEFANETRIFVSLFKTHE